MKNHLLLAVLLTILTSTVVNALSVVSACGTDLKNTTDLNWQLNQNITSATYSSCLLLNTSNIILDCAGYTINTQDSSSYYIGINVSASNNTIKNCVLKNFTKIDFFTGEYGNALLVNASNLTVYNTTFTENYYGVFFANNPGAGKNHTFYNLSFLNYADLSFLTSQARGFKTSFGSDRVANSTFYGITATNLSGYLFELSGVGPGISIFNNNFYNFSADYDPHVIFVSGPGSVLIYNNTFTNIQYGVSLGEVNYTFENNRIVNYSRSFFDDGSDVLSATIRNNVFINGTGTADSGLKISSDNALVYSNYFENIVTEVSPEGIFLFGGAPIFISDAINITTTNNTFVNSTRGVVLSGVSNATSYNDVFVLPQGFEYTVGRGSMTNHYPNLTIINATFRANASSLDIINGGSIAVKQLVNATVYNNGVLNVGGPTVNVYNNTADLTESQVADGSGNVYFNLTYLFASIDGISNHTPHNFTYDNTTEIVYKVSTINYQNSYFPVLLKTVVPDITPPVLSFNLPANNTNQTTTTINLKFTATDADLDSCWYSINQTANISVVGCISGNANNLLPTISEGIYQNITIYANDTTGNTASSIRYFNIDSTAPVISVNRPLNNTNQSSTSLTINFSATDSMPLAICMYSINNTANVTITGCLNSSTNQTSATVSNGIYQNVTIYVNDSLGNLASLTKIFNIDTIPPTITTPTTTLTTTTAAINWTTNEQTNATINYGTTTALGTTNTNTSNSTIHVQTLLALTSGTLYYYNITACDSFENCNTTGPHSLTTTSESTPTSSSGGGSGRVINNFTQTQPTQQIQQTQEETENQTPTQKPIIQETKKETSKQQEYLPKTSQTPQETTTEIPWLPIALLLLVIISAIIAYTQFKKEKTMTSIVAKINESYEKPTVKPAVEKINTPIENQIIKPQTVHKKEKIELYSQLPQLRATTETTNLENTWDVLDDSLDIPAQVQEPEKLSLSQRALNKIKSIFQ